jgi:hypothetical protein
VFCVENVLVLMLLVLYSACKLRAAENRIKGKVAGLNLDVLLPGSCLFAQLLVLFWI